MSAGWKIFRYPKQHLDYRPTGRRKRRI